MTYPKHRAGWTTERVDLLKQLHAQGFSASQMAKALGGVTRNAAIGKCVRLGLGPIGGGKASAPSRAKAAPKPARKPAPKGVMVLPEMKGGDVATANRVENIAARAQLAENVVLLSRGFTPLTGRQPVPFGSPGCRWPVAGEGADMMCCGAPRDEGRAEACSYCATHAAAAFQKPTAKTPKNGNELARALRRWVA